MDNENFRTRRGILPAGIAGFGLAMASSLPGQTSGDSAFPVFNVRSFRAAADGKTLDTAAIQSAVDACTQAGGGYVYFPAGRYLSGTITLKDNVTLHFAPGATLLGSQRVEDYPAKPFPARDLDVGGFNIWALIYADGARNVAIEGGGILDGNGKPFPPKRPVDNPDHATGMRPRLLFLKGCTGVSIRDVTLRQSSCWIAHFTLCERLVIRGVYVYSDYFVNQDGIVLDSCKNVAVSDCIVDTVDDSIVIKASYPQMCQNIAVTNCVITTQCAGLKFGTQSLGGFRNVSISNCVFYDCPLGGLKFTAVDGGPLEDVTVSNITMHGVAAPLFFRLGNRAQDFGFKEVKHPLPVSRVRNIVVSDLRAEVSNSGKFPGQRPLAPRIGDTMGIMGLPEHPVENIVLDNVHVTFPGAGTIEEARRSVIPERSDAYPENTMFGVLPAYGFYVRHAKRITLSRVRLDVATPDARPAMICNNVEDLDLHGFVAASSGPEPLIRLQSTRRATLQSCRPAGVAERFLRVEGSDSSDITLMTCDLRTAREALSKSDGFLGDFAQAGNLVS